MESLGLPRFLSTDNHEILFFYTKGGAREKIIVQFMNDKFLKMIQVNASIRDEICCSLEATGIYVFADKSNASKSKLLARHFPVNLGEQEDIATGAIASTVAKHIWRDGKSRSIDIFQGGKYSNSARIIVSKNALSDSWHVIGECFATECMKIQDFHFSQS
ncbi:PhzF family phenazine biosynthesis protein [Advenella sp. S44]|uniref:PhzF family phenazine biosynthesis protein n=1 Tax=Advenella sp. S44 TaxID=1982755 RepID=UPI00137477DB|nr:PhzF family phenazine biosynthesis protein [Advenella sp. S44]